MTKHRLANRRQHPAEEKQITTNPIDESGFEIESPFAEVGKTGKVAEATKRNHPWQRKNTKTKEENAEKRIELAS